MSETGKIQLSFFNTSHLSGERLKEVIEQCNTQERRIVEIMADGRQRTPFEVQGEYERIYSATPITSIRRAMTVLTRKSYLIKCEKTKVEVYGHPNHTWAINRSL